MSIHISVYLSIYLYLSLYRLPLTPPYHVDHTIPYGSRNVGL